mmetsp:Transcript_37273/g.88184  ORF Transcript_37273/g.88184 Transcript_37273/m.88184 type:complete len:226 (-) Transcript_37273:760-1437(-)
MVKSRSGSKAMPLRKESVTEMVLADVALAVLCSMVLMVKFVHTRSGAEKPGSLARVRGAVMIPLDRMSTSACRWARSGLTTPNDTSTISDARRRVITGMARLPVACAQTPVGGRMPRATGSPAIGRAWSAVRVTVRPVSVTVVYESAKMVATDEKVTVMVFSAPGRAVACPMAPSRNSLTKSGADGPSPLSVSDGRVVARGSSAWIATAGESCAVSGFLSRKKKE